MDSDERVIDELGDRMKSYEKVTESIIDQTKPVIVRIDGHKFSKFTKGFNRPFDARLHEAMKLTTEDLVKQFNAYLGYTESDEITLIFPECNIEKRQEFIFAGRVQKIASLIASYTAVRFNYHLMRQDFSLNQGLESKSKSMIAHFDARVFNVPDRNEALNNLIWRSLFDCRRNSVASLAQSQFPHKELFGYSTSGLIEKLKNEKGIDWENQDSCFKYGTYVKKEQYEKIALDQKTGQNVSVQRSRLKSKSFLLDGFNQNNIDLIFNKYW